MHKPKSVPKNETHKILWDFEILTYHRKPARKSNIVVKKEKKRNLANSELCSPGGQQSENQRKREERRVPCQRTKKLWNTESMEMPIIIGALGTAPKCLVRGLKELKIGGQTETIKPTRLL